VLDPISHRYRHLPVVTDGAGKQVSLDRVLIASRQGVRGNVSAELVASVINEDPARPVIRGVEGNLDLNPALGPQEVHPLVGHELSADRKGGVSRGEIKDGRRQAV